MNTWYYTLIFTFCCLVVIRFLTNVIINIRSDEPTKLILSDKEKIFYGGVMAYLITYLIY